MNKKQSKPEKKIKKKDNYLFVLTVSIFSTLIGIALLKLPQTLSYFNREVFNGEYSTLVNYLDERPFYVAVSELDPIFSSIKGSVSDETTFFGRIEKYDGFYNLKLQNSGLVIDEDGEVIAKEDVGKIKAPFKFLIVGGSSMVEDLGITLESRLSQIPESTVFRKGVYSSGLNLKDYFNWNRELKVQIAENQPDIILAKFGGNDGQRILDYDTGIVHFFGTAEWDRVYTERVREFMTTASNGSQKIYWIGTPIPSTEEFRIKLTKTNEIQSTVANEFDNIEFISTWDRFAVNGFYSQFIANDAGVRWAAKYEDGIHLTMHGSGILADLLIPIIEEDLLYED